MQKDRKKSNDIVLTALKAVDKQADVLFAKGWCSQCFSSGIGVWQSKEKTIESMQAAVQLGSFDARAVLLSSGPAAPEELTTASRFGPHGRLFGTTILGGLPGLRCTAGTGLGLHPANQSWRGWVRDGAIHCRQM